MTRPRIYAGTTRQAQFTLRSADIALLQELGRTLPSPGIAPAIRQVIDDDRRRNGLPVDAAIERKADDD